MPITKPNRVKEIPIRSLGAVGFGKKIIAPITSPIRNGEATIRNHPIASVIHSNTLYIGCN
jgi:hypothetical protein